ncbi:DUF427 domain-containing protein [Mycolicibacterium grossiae]|uniref:DUF427 domain-containing protein n=1 Tax=Mycolicibacterium grossiae TaxID=1552759 RepID=A0A1E8Q7L7_9MYCO|nr:DUF427 domain-containing protein [Mycolicibacterium grossiae]OFJ54009.1 hypothetical protein BEL07_09085 [Mycolicibacterium grossiae]QEM44193.1 DUF427 domain-containing protein [Mycolicibacterium grossiae]
MSERQVLQPTAEHPITITPTEGHVVVRVGDQVVAETDTALSLQEASYPVVQYVPLGAVDERVLRRSDTATYCPYKGEASYYDVTVGGDTVSDAVWTYEHPYPAVAAIDGHVAFYPDKAQVTVD